jgi:hypothetical protein
LSHFLCFQSGGIGFVVEGEPPGPYVGYVGGVASISAPDRTACVMGLIEKHVVGLPEGQLVSLLDYLKRRDQAVSGRSATDDECHET